MTTGPDWDQMTQPEIPAFLRKGPAGGVAQDQRQDRAQSRIPNAMGSGAPHGGRAEDPKQPGWPKGTGAWADKGGGPVEQAMAYLNNTTPQGNFQNLQVPVADTASAINKLGMKQVAKVGDVQVFLGTVNNRSARLIFRPGKPNSMLTVFNRKLVEQHVVNHIRMLMESDAAPDVPGPQKMVPAHDAKIAGTASHHKKREKAVPHPDVNMDDAQWLDLDVKQVKEEAARTTNSFLRQTLRELGIDEAHMGYATLRQGKPKVVAKPKPVVAEGLPRLGSIRYRWINS